MDRNSFKACFRARSAVYRTPSPPLEAVEPLSVENCEEGRRPWPWTQSLSDGFESKQAWSGQVAGYQRRQKAPKDSTHPSPRRDTLSIQTSLTYQAGTSPSRLDVFAAVATSPRQEESFRAQSNAALESQGERLHWQQHHKSITQNGQHLYGPSGWEERPAKRPRSKHDKSNRYEEHFSRPATSYSALGCQQEYEHGVQHNLQAQCHGNGSIVPPRYGHGAVADNSFSDAELLLSFARSSSSQPSDLRTAQRRLMNGVSSHDSSISPNDRYKANLHSHMPDYHARFDWQTKLTASLDSPEGLRSQQTVNATIPGPKMAEKTSLSSDTQYTTHSRVAPASLEGQSLIEQEGKPRVRKGWPKGKPRGSRLSATGPKKGIKATAKGTAGYQKQSRSAKSKKSVAAASQVKAPLYRPTTTTSMIGPANQSYQSGLRHCSESRTIQSNAERPEQTGRHVSAPPYFDTESTTSLPTSKSSSKPSEQTNVCAACKFTKVALNGFRELWISCNGCKLWFHYNCAGFKSERDVRDVDKFYCPTCEPIHGTTTTVRKSSRAHAALDYAGLNEGVVRTNADVLEHHFIKHIKAGNFEFTPESFPRMRPELVTAEYFEALGGFTEPVVIPAAWNPRPNIPGALSGDEVENAVNDEPRNLAFGDQEYFSSEYEYDCVSDDGQDKLDMVIPQGLTVRRVAELYGPEEKVDVIDVKNQAGEDKRWNMRQWADYYEADGEKPVRNVISLEVSSSKLGRLIRRPEAVRAMDLQDAVWPLEELAKGNYPNSVQFYCLMSVADCYTDFHIDFGGSSVYYHILKGKKTFFFIPPKNKNLKKYEDWCNSNHQNEIWLPNETQECYRVDLSEGDTMLIPSGWIHSVWTPENSLVIGGNFLTRMHHAMQIRVNEIEKNTKVARKFRYPFFQKVLWFSVIDYLKKDPIPSTVVKRLYNGSSFERSSPIWLDFDRDKQVDNEDPEQFNARYYSQSEMEGLPALLDYVLRTVKISMGKIEGITKETRNAVTRSMPKNYGDPFDLLKTFSMWVGWKRGNEVLPAWAYPYAQFPDPGMIPYDKKPSTVAQKRLERQGTSQSTPDRRSARQLEATKALESQSEENTMELDPNPSITEATQLSEPPLSTGTLPWELVERVGVTIIEEPMPELPLKNAVVAVVIEPGPSNLTTPIRSKAELQSPVPNPIAVSEDYASLGDPSKKPRSKACIDCRKSKRRCVHDDKGLVDPVKAMERSIPRGSNKTKRPFTGGADESDQVIKKTRTDSRESLTPYVIHENDELCEEHTTNDSEDPILQADPSLPLSELPALVKSYDQRELQEANLDAGGCKVESPISLDVELELLEGAIKSTSDTVMTDAPTEAMKNQEIVTNSKNLQADSSAIPSHETPNKVEDAGLRSAATESPPVQPEPKSQHDTTTSDHSKSEEKSSTSSPQMVTLGTERPSQSQSPPSSPLTDFSSASPVPEEDHQKPIVSMEPPSEPGRSLRRTTQSQRTAAANPSPTANSPLQTQEARMTSSRASTSSIPKLEPIPVKRSTSKRKPSPRGNQRSTEIPKRRSKDFSPVAVEATEEEDESMMLARQLAEQEFGLRRRGK